MNDNAENPVPSGAPEGERTVRQDKLPQRVPVAAGAFPKAIVPANMDEAWRVATLLVRSGLAPRDVNTPERAMVAVMTGLELGLPPMTAIQRIAVINGRPCIWGDAVPAIAQRTGMLEAWDEGISGEGDEMVAYCKVTRRINSESTITKSATFSVADAKKAGLWTTDTKVQRKGRNGEMYTKDNDSPWYRYPKRMLQMRARVAFRDLFADAMCGLYVAEELVGRDSDAEMRDVTPRMPTVIHNPLEDEADAERPARDVREDIREPSGAVILGGDEAERALTDDVPEVSEEERTQAAEYFNGVDPARTGPLPDHDPETGEVFDANAGTVMTEEEMSARAQAVAHAKDLERRDAEAVTKPAEPPKATAVASPRARPRPTPRQARTEAAGDPKAESAPKQPPAEKTSPGANAALGIAFPQPWIRKTAAEYELYLVQWTVAWFAYGKDPDGLRNRYSAERTIRSGLGEPADHDTLTKWKGIAADVFKKLGGQS
jgi:hypothetical protein